MKPLNPIMAVLVIASVGAAPLRTLAADGDKTAPAAAPLATDEKNPVNALAKILTSNADARKDAGARIEDFLLKPVDGKSFVADDVNSDAIGKVAREWGEKAGPVGSVAMLYFVVGPGTVSPGWAQADPILSKTFNPGAKWEGRLRAALAAWTGKAQIVKKTEKTQVTGFLNDAATKASTVFADPRTKAEIDLSVAANDNTAPQVPDPSKSPRTGLEGASRQYGFNELYIDGAEVKDVAGPGDANSRKISIKIYSKRVDGVIVNEVGIFDITDHPDDVFGQRFPIGPGTKSFKLDDRTPGHKGYELSFGPVGPDEDRTITFARPGEKGDGGIKTSVKELFLKRADQAANMGNIVSVGGEEFYVVPQGGARSALSLFPKKLIDGRRDGGKARRLEPLLFAEVGKVGPNGRNQNVEPGEKGGPMLGRVGETDYKLVFNRQLGLWEAKEGLGDPPTTPKKPDAPATSTGTAPGGTTPGGTTPGGTTPGGNQPEMAIADLEKYLLLKNQNCAKFDKDTESMADRLKGKYGMVMCNPSGKPNGNQAILLVPKSVWSDQQMTFSSIAADPAVTPPSPAAVLLKGRIVDHYLVLQFDTQTQYRDLDKKTEGGFELAGLVASKDVGGPPAAAGLERPGMNNMIIFLDALRNYMGLKSDHEVFAEVPKRVKAHVGEGKPVELEARFAGESLVVIAKGGGPKFQIWPKVNLPDAPPPSTQYAHLGGPANVFESEVSSMDAPFKDKDDFAGSYQLERIGAKVNDIALYQWIDPTGKDKTEKYYLSFKYLGYDTANADPASAKVKKIFRQKYFEAFNKDNPLPANRDMQGLSDTKAEVRGQLAYRFIGGTNAQKGVLAVFQNAQLTGEQKDAKGNCVGPIVWWGVSNRDAALKICQNDKF